VFSNIYHQHDVTDLKRISKKDVRASFIRMVSKDANSRMTGSAMARIGRSFTHRLLELGEEKLGPPPVPYCFIALLVHNALNRTPPLGFFRKFVMEEDGKHQKIFNLKCRDTLPLSDLIRVHSLACGSKAQNSFKRLNDIGLARLIPYNGIENLRDAMESLTIVRIRHQALAIEAGQQPDHNVRPEDNIALTSRTLYRW